MDLLIDLLWLGMVDFNCNLIDDNYYYLKYFYK